MTQTGKVMESLNQQIFLLAAKAGSLEGYLFGRKDVEPLANWVDNIVQMYRDLSPGARQEIAPVLAPVIEKALEYGGETLAPEFKEKLGKILKDCSTG